MNNVIHLTKNVTKQRAFEIFTNKVDEILFEINKEYNEKLIEYKINLSSLEEASKA